jgi:hypothetical protein
MTGARFAAHGLVMVPQGAQAYSLMDTDTFVVVDIIIVLAIIVCVATVWMMRQLK